MNTSGIRVHIAGSAAYTAGHTLLSVAHEFVSSLASRLIDSGSGLVMGFGNEPLGEQGLSCTFDWTILDVIAESRYPDTTWPSDQPGRFRAIGSQRALDRVPETRQVTWDTCINRADFELELSPPGWRMGGVIRAAQVLRGDVLVAIGGGAGVEQLADLYSQEGKSIVPIRCDIGAYSNDGNGGSSYLHGRALSEPGSFFELQYGAGSAPSRLTQLKVEPDSDPATAAEQACSLIGDLSPPLAFYARLLAPDLEEFEQVEEFFRQVVDPVVVEKGMAPYEVGRHRPNAAFINVEIFERLHRAYLVVADLTAVRPNCTMELGYALARRRRVIITAKEGTRLPFDPDKLPTHFWSPMEGVEERRDSFRAWLESHLDIPPLVR